MNCQQVWVPEDGNRHLERWPKADRCPCLSGTVILLLLSYSKVQVLLKNPFSCAALDRHLQNSGQNAWDSIKNQTVEGIHVITY